VHAENFLIDESGNGQAIENVAENAPESDGVSAFALVVEAVDAVDLGAFVVASEQEKVLRVLDFVAQKQAHRLDRLLSTVDVVAHKEIVSLGREAAVLEDPEQVVVLTMHVTCTHSY